MRSSKSRSWLSMTVAVAGALCAAVLAGSAATSAESTAKPQTPGAAMLSAPSSSPGPSEHLEAAVQARLTKLLTAGGAKSVEGVPAHLRQGILGISLRSQGREILVLGQDADHDSVREGVLSGLPEEASQFLEIESRPVEGRDLAAAWAAVRSVQVAEGLGPLVIDVDAARGVLEVSHAGLSVDEQQKLQSVAQGLARFVESGGFVRLNG